MTDLRSDPVPDPSSDPLSDPSSDSVLGDTAAYYDRNTPRFLRGGATAFTGALHRSLRGPRVRTAADSVNEVHHIILGVLASHGLFVTPGRPLVADLGCGVGASVEWMNRHAGVEAVGITVSRVQAAIATRRLGPDVVLGGSFLSEGDLGALTGARRLRAAFMIESFVHTERPDRLFALLAAHMEPGGLLVICDDFPTRRLLDRLDIPPGSQGSRAARLDRVLTTEFRRGWRVRSFLGVHQVAALAAAGGWRLVGDTDLSRSVDLSGPRHLAARAVLGPARRLGLRSSWWDSVRGGGALQRLIRRRGVTYRVLTFRNGG